MTIKEWNKTTIKNVNENRMPENWAIREKKMCEWEPFELDLDEYKCVCLPIFIAFIAAINVIRLIFIFVHKMDKPQNRLMCVYARLWSLAVLPISLVVIIGLAPSSYLLGARTSFFCCCYMSVLCCGQRFFIWSAKKRSNTNYTLKYRKDDKIRIEKIKKWVFLSPLPNNSWNTTMEFSLGFWCGDQNHQ